VIYLRAGVVPYDDAWAWQRDLHARRVADEIADTTLLLEHPAVYTAGRRTEQWERPADGTPVVDVDRGGKITWHGPGQLVGYPITRLPDPVDVVGHVRRIEQALIDVCDAYGVTAGRVEGRSGVWVENAKVAAIGIRVAQGVTMHGFALNCDADLTAYDRIVPCGIRDAGVTSLSVLTGARITTDDVVDRVEAALSHALSITPEPVRG
jgi:lipoyl(octanoyl) transferase